MKDILFLKYFFLNYWYIIEDIPFPVIIFFFLLATADSWTTFFRLLWIHPVLD